MAMVTKNSIVVAAAACQCAAALGQRVEFETIAVTGDAAPGTNGAIFAAVGRGAIDRSGDVVFWADLALGTGDADETSASGLWRTLDGDLQLVARHGMEAPGAGETVFGQFIGLTPPVVRGNIAFAESLSGEGFRNRRGVFVSRPDGSTGAVAHGTAEAPGTGGATFDLVGQPAVSATGEVAFEASLQFVFNGPVTNANDTGLWSNAGGALRLLVREGSLAPDTDGAVFDQFLQRPPAMNGIGDVAFGGSLKPGGGVDQTNQAGIWCTAGNQIQLVARAGSHAAGTSGGLFEWFRTPRLNDAGDVAFQAELQQGVGGVDDKSDTGLWMRSSGQLLLLAREGDSVATAPDWEYEDLGDTLVLSDTGRLACTARLRRGINPPSTYEYDIGVLITDGPVIRPVARLGDAAPGADGALFDGFGDPVINRSGGTVVFQAGLQGSGVDGSNNSGLWAYVPHRDEMLLIIREGDIFDVNDDPLVDDLRVIRSIALANSPDWVRTCVNDANQVAFWLHFVDDTSGIFIATLPTCRCELDSSPGLNVFDLLAYLDLWFTMDPAAEFDDDPAQVNVFDLLAYLDCWFAGCD